MVIHILIDIPQEHARDDGNRSKGDGDEIHIAIALRVGDLTCLDDDGVGGFVGADAGDGFQFSEEGCAC